ncbi:FmdB family zinc ribbon protein [Sphaerochaeta sp. S2]|uniref:FmdB family zinc ribbon protein n=1 Tax=Sphaerochaeta sp. S2 TaxID=2798868 RepID=UPI0018E96C89|nr:FmdB family zinc ribbon protein [Sphaerochaeta sp. S2]MBJ2356309.1 zinc ribbon domain-containing protein [Sphaerochaeta sp. S2]MDY0244580.1 zinc ribbon domain-containing protein [Sphaerochaeta sp.]
MPSYEYECQLCKARVELVQSLDKHEPPAVCPSCNMEHTMRRVNKPSSFHGEQDGQPAEVEQVDEKE